MKLQLVVTVLLVGCTFTPSLAVPLPGEGEVRAMLQAIQKLFASENRESKQAESAARSTPPTAYSPTPLNKTVHCAIEDSLKTECGHSGIDQSQCETDGCCWKESAVSGVPSCYFQSITGSDEPECQHANRLACGYQGINSSQCMDWGGGGCCWSPTTVPGQPWCYYTNDAFPHCQTEPHNRVECGYSGISGVPCKQKGCCWSPTGIAGAPWCFAKSSATANKQFQRT